MRLIAAAQGLAQKIAETLSKEGANLALVDVDQVKLKDAVGLCLKKGRRVIDGGLRI